MFIQQFYDEGLAHLSYMIGDKKKAIVIDPHLDIADYLAFAQNKGVNITHIFETHRNEDYVIGSRSLSALTGAAIYHGQHLDFKYGEPVDEGDVFKINNIHIKIIETPGHTPESISLIIYDKSSSDSPYAVFTGDALFVGSVGRTDLWKTREEAAGILYDSLYDKILPLGDHVLLYPAHGAGSVCGDGMGARNFSTIGFEKKYNDGLQAKDKKAFIEHQKARAFEVPPYFKEMEKRNQTAPDILIKLPQPKILKPENLEDDKIQLVDVRSPQAYASVSIPGSIAIPGDMLSKFAGWFLSYDKPIVLIAENDHELQTAVRHLIRIGYNKFKGWFKGTHGWEITGKDYWHIPTIHAQQLKNRLEEDYSFTVLDVRTDKEWEAGHLPGAKHIYIGELMNKWKEIPQNGPVTTFCGSGKRALIAASILKQQKFAQVEVCFGSMMACKEIGCPIEQPK